MSDEKIFVAVLGPHHKSMDFLYNILADAGFKPYSFANRNKELVCEFYYLPSDARTANRRIASYSRRGYLVKVIILSAKRDDLLEANRKEFFYGSMKAAKLNLLDAVRKLNEIDMQPAEIFWFSVETLELYEEIYLKELKNFING